MPPKKKQNTKLAQVTFKVNNEREFKKYVKYLSNPWHVAWRNFLVGAFHGLGFVIGSALLLSLFGYFVSDIFANIPVFSQFAEVVQIWMESTLESKE